ncbi:MAG: hypothetical protein R2762_09430 [Bryobacteraceae bacterium]
MKRNLIATMLLAAGGLFAQYGGGYGRPDYRDQPYDPRYDSPYNDGYNQGYSQSGYVAVAPPRAPVYGPAFRRPPMPGPGFVWVDGFWNFHRGRYIWVSGYWMRPPFVGSYWVAPRYTSGRFFAGFWAGSRANRHDRGRVTTRGPVRGHGYRR